MIVARSTCHLLCAVRRLAPLALLLCFWGISVFNLDRFPFIHEDEPWILSPGYKLFTQGVYGSDLFTGFYHIERIYLEFLPLMAWLQGATTWLFGVGILQLRYAPVALGFVTLALTYTLGRTLDSGPRTADDHAVGSRRPYRPAQTGSAVGLLAMLLLLTWQWTPAGERWFASGIPLVDLSRIARYDILVAPLGLAALWCFLRTRETASLRFDFLSGVFAGLAGLAHIYGLFWVMILALMTLRVERPLTADNRPPSAIRRPIPILLGALVVWTPWLSVIALNWNDYIGQNFQYSARFAVLAPTFYLNNVLNEPYRYHLGVSHAATITRLGFWLLVGGVPTALVWLGARVWRRRNRNEWRFFVPALVMPWLFALLIDNKQYNYVAPIAPLFALVIAWALAAWLRSTRMGLRALTVALIALLCWQGMLGLWQMQLAASRAESPERVFADLRAILPPTALVFGVPRYWLARPTQPYRSVVSLPQLADPRVTPAALRWDAALALIAPQFILLDPELVALFADRDTARARERNEQYAAYLRAHHARLIRELRDERGGPMQVYQLDP